MANIFSMTVKCPIDRAGLRYTSNSPLYGVNLSSIFPGEEGGGGGLAFLDLTDTLQVFLVGLLRREKHKKCGLLLL